MKSPPKTSRDPHMARVWRASAIAIGGALVLIAVPLALFGPGQPNMSAGVRMVGWTGFIGAGAMWGLVFGIRVFARADEFLRDRDKTAWLWGGLTGTAVSAPIYVVLMMGGLHGLDPTHVIGPARALSLGYSLLLVSQLAGYVAVAIWLKVSGR